MKKLVSLLLALVLVASFVAGAFVSEVEAVPACEVYCIDGHSTVCCWEYIGKNRLEWVCRASGPC